MSIAYIPKSLANQIFNLPVLCIYASAFPQKAIAPTSGSSTNGKTNHWVLHLAISQTESIRLDPSPDGQYNLILIVTKKRYLVSRNAIKTLQLHTAEG
jgi:hypothetical protein